MASKFLVNLCSPATCNCKFNFFQNNCLYIKSLFMSNSPYEYSKIEKSNSTQPISYIHGLQLSIQNALYKFIFIFKLNILN